MSFTTSDTQQSTPTVRLVGLDKLSECGERLRNGELVAFPTETVYGLGAHAMDPDACRKIFAAKERPLTDPLIVHVNEASQAHALWAAFDNDNDSDNKREQHVLTWLGQSFWPGPLTLVARAAAHVPDLVMAGTGFVACRSPQHIVARALLEAAQVPLAAPSANKFGHVSPTTAQHVFQDLQHEPVWILQNDDKDDDNFDSTTTTATTCQVGVESSVVKVEMVMTTTDQSIVRLTMLRQGAVSLHQLKASLLEHGMDPNTVELVSNSHKQVSEQVSTISPGQTIRHYSPHIASFLVSQDCIRRQSTATPSPQEQQVLREAVVIDYGQALVAWKESARAYRDLSPTGNSTAAAQAVFETLRWAEAVPGATRILFPDLAPGNDQDALAWAVKDRLTRAASGTVIDSLLSQQQQEARATATSETIAWQDMEPERLMELSVSDAQAQQTLEQDSYWQKWLSDKLAIDKEIGSPYSVATQWRNDKHGDWNCYWDDSWKQPTDDLETNYVFRPHLERTHGGALISPLVDVNDTTLSTIRPRETYQILQTLVEIGQSDSLSIGWGDEGDGRWEPVLIPWKIGDALTVTNLLTRLGAHPKLQEPIMTRESVLHEDGEDVDEAISVEPIQDFLNAYQTSLVFWAGSEKLNPVPCFAVAQVREDLVAGFVGGIVHT